jgi:hypothetical protein
MAGSAAGRLDLSNVNRVDRRSAAAMLAAASAPFPDVVNPPIRNPRPPVYRTLLHCRQPGRWDLQFFDDMAPARAWPGRVMATS